MCRWFNVRLKDPDRNINKRQWKEISQWRRKCERAIDTPEIKQQISQNIQDLLIYGTTVI